jgi:ribosome-associated heat shock protein Hsp15
MKQDAAPAAAPLRLDKWLWAARLFKTRSLAVQAIELGRVEVNGHAAKASRDVHVGDRIVVRQPPFVHVLDVRGLSHQRGPARVAQALYEETAESVAERERIVLQRRSEPALARQQGRPTKRERRDLAEWNRWSASIDDDD